MTSTDEPRFREPSALVAALRSSRWSGRVPVCRLDLPPRSAFGHLVANPRSGEQQRCALPYGCFQTPTSESKRGHWTLLFLGACFFSLSFLPTEEGFGAGLLHPRRRLAF